MFVLQTFEVLITEKNIHWKFSLFSIFKNIHYENFGTFSVAHGYEKLGNSKIYIQFFT